jgi:hypothetical protein
VRLIWPPSPCYLKDTGREEQHVEIKRYQVSKQGQKGKEPVPVLNQAPRHEDVWGSGGIAPRINMGARYEGEWSASCPARSTPVPIGEEAGWPPDPVWTRRRREKSPYPCLESNSGRPARSLVTILTELSRLFVSGSHRKYNANDSTVRELKYATMTVDATDPKLRKLKTKLCCNLRRATAVGLVTSDRIPSTAVMQDIGHCHFIYMYMTFWEMALSPSSSDCHYADRLFCFCY